MIHPGCFGIPSVFSFVSGVCANCREFGDCQAQSHYALTLVDQSLVSDLLRQHENFANAQGVIRNRGGLETTRLPVRKTKILRVEKRLSEEQEGTIARASKKVGEYLRKLYLCDIESKISSAIQNERNPFCSDGARPYHAAYEAITTGSISKGYLTTMFQEDLGWSKASAKSQTSVVWGVFVALDLAVEDGAYLIASPRIPADNRSNRKFWRGK